MIVNIHASCVVLARAGEAFGARPDDGILILGESGSGKSSVALELIARGALLVADDRADLFAHENVLWARAPARLAGLIEARSLGIVALPCAAGARVALAIRLVEAGKTPRFPAPQTFEAPAELGGVKGVPLFDLPAGDATTPTRIVLAAAALSNALFRQEGKSE